MKKILLILLFLSISGCASITGSKNQPLSVTATLEGKPVVGANCELLNDKGKWFGWEVERIGPVESNDLYAAAKAFAQSVGAGDIKVKHESESTPVNNTVPF